MINPGREAFCKCHCCDIRSAPKKWVNDTKLDLGYRMNYEEEEVREKDPVPVGCSVNSSGIWEVAAFENVTPTDFQGMFGSKKKKEKKVSWF